MHSLRDSASQLTDEEEVSSAYHAPRGPLPSHASASLPSSSYFDFQTGKEMEISGRRPPRRKRSQRIEDGITSGYTSDAALCSVGSPAQRVTA